MKRCSNCGYMNLQTESVCKNCNTSLDKAHSFHFPPAETQMVDPKGTKAEPLPMESEEAPEKRPRRTEVVSQSSHNSSSKSKDSGSSIKSCPECDYPVMSRSTSCPNCGHKFISGKVTPPKKTLKLTNIESIDEAGQTKGFSLVSVKNKTRNPFRGNHITINRRNLDQNNLSISSQEHVNIYHKDGKWYAKDLSSNGATFIQLKGTVELKDGDMIILGNKMYRFEAES